MKGRYRTGEQSLTSHRRMKLTTELKAKGRAAGTPCWLCGKPIWWDAPPNHPWGCVVDEVHPRSRGGHSTSKDNCRLAHRWCNGSRGNRPPRRLNGPPAATQAPIRTSRPW